ncbi:MAG: 2OG-Fe(II) oxygenase [Bdellovibrionales bacterium]|nr:2OG-Fe(II) oxygenase [Bdellovibrionales bacterium]
MAWNPVINDLIEVGYSIKNNLFLPTDLESMHDELARLYEEDNFKKASTAIGVQPSVRGDMILWLNEENSNPFKDYLAALEDLRQTLNQELYLGANATESHATMYPVNKHYDKHVDNFKGKNSRKLSVILYLNKDWKEQDGGELVIYNTDNETIASVLPEIGTFVVFLSEMFPHEVKTCFRERASLTSWLRR